MDENPVGHMEKPGLGFIPVLGVIYCTPVNSVPSFRVRVWGGYRDPKPVFSGFRVRFRVARRTSGLSDPIRPGCLLRGLISPKTVLSVSYIGLRGFHRNRHVSNDGPPGL